MKQTNAEIRTALQFIKDRQCVAISTLTFYGLTGIETLVKNGLITVGILEDIQYVILCPKGLEFLQLKP
ncbi:MAG: hypothetical protein EOO43_26515 [Flavobacterium sp.]|nr:MAG: hypothetical protein EOO43_26515 [Flavobacterium sp.]